MYSWCTVHGPSYPESITSGWQICFVTGWQHRGAQLLASSLFSLASVLARSHCESTWHTLGVLVLIASLANILHLERPSSILCVKNRAWFISSLQTSSASSRPMYLTRLGNAAFKASLSSQVFSTEPLPTYLVSFTTPLLTVSLCIFLSGTKE